jgi:hypothetical protein
MTINSLRRALIKSSVVLGDINAVMRGKIVQRIGNRMIGRAVRKLTRGVWMK